MLITQTHTRTHAPPPHTNTHTHIFNYKASINTSALDLITAEQQGYFVHVEGPYKVFGEGTGASEVTNGNCLNSAVG